MAMHLRSNQKPIFESPEDKQTHKKHRLRSKLRSIPRSVPVLVIAIVGSYLLYNAMAATPTNHFEAEDATLSGNASTESDTNASNGAFVKFNAPLSNTAKRFFADTASFNKKASELGFTGGAYDTKYSGNVFDYSGVYGWPNDGLIPSASRQAYLPQERGNWNLALRNYSIPIYDAADATTTIRIYQQNEARNTVGYPWERSDTYGSLAVGANGVRLGDSIPWNPAWTRPPGVDGIVAVVNYQTGEAWDIYNYDIDKIGCNAFHNWNNDNGNNQPGFLGGAVPSYNPVFDANNASHKCAQSIAHYTNIFTDPGTVSDRGAGFAKLATITRAAEVESGEIKHALALTLFNQMFGPACSPNNTLAASGAGDSCAVYQAPGSKVEHLSVFANNACGNDQPVSTNTTRARTVASGQRFALNVTDQEITNWLDARGYTGTKRNTARIFAVAMRDYGFIVAETGCANRPHIETDGFVNADTKRKWENLGVTDTSGYDGDADGKTDYPSQDFLWTGLITKERIRLVNPQ